MNYSVIRVKKQGFVRRVLLMLLCSISIVAFAQKKPLSESEVRANFHNRIALVTPDGRDSVIMRVSFIWPKGKYEKQTRIGVVDTLGNETWYSADQVIMIRDKRKAYRTVQMKGEDGTFKRIFPRRMYYGEDGAPSVYKVYNMNGSYRYYLQYGTDGVLFPMEKEDDPAYGNKLKEYMNSKNDSISGNAEIAKYISTVKTNRISIGERLHVIKTQNTNLIPRFRWGVGVGMISSSILTSYDIMESAKRNQAHMTLNAFADIAAYGGLSFHPEVSFDKTSVKDYFPMENGREIAFNRTDVLLPLICRYSPTFLRGKVLPFVEVGPQVELAMKSNSMERAYRLDDEGYIIDSYDFELDTKATLVTLAVGGGLEYKMMPKHSLFLNARYVFGGNGINSDGNQYNLKKNSLVVSLSVNL